MAQTLTLTRRLVEREISDAAIPSPYELPVIDRNSVDWLGRLYFEAYAPDHVESEADARDEINAAFANEFGVLDQSLYPLAHINGVVAAAVMSVSDAPWPDAPRGPFVIDVMTSPAHRRRGVARALLTIALNNARAAGATRVSLRVLADNVAALALYAALGFEQAPRIDVVAPQPNAR